MSLYISNGIRADFGHNEGLLDDGSLALYARGCIADLQRTIVIDRRPFGNGGKGVAVMNGVRQPLHDNNGHTIPKHWPLGFSIECLALTIW